MPSLINESLVPRFQNEGILRRKASPITGNKSSKVVQRYKPRGLVLGDTVRLPN